MTRTVSRRRLVHSSWPFGSFSRIILRFACWLLLTCLFYVSGSSAVQCFCTAKDCKDPLCESNWCLVGFKSDDLVQTCATEQAKALLKCARKLNEWEEVCSCTEDYCNTFSFMRATLKKYDELRAGIPGGQSNELENIDTSNLEDKDARKGKKGSVNKHLIVLLVVVPLGIGAVTVCLVFLNYHCKMC